MEKKPNHGGSPSRSFAGVKEAAEKLGKSGKTG
jgi:hypothetical protein